jgi:hypothetical protein
MKNKPMFDREKLFLMSFLFPPLGIVLLAVLICDAADATWRGLVSLWRWWIEK